MVKHVKGNWELYNLADNISETNNLISEVDEKFLKEMFDDYNKFAERTGVFPRDFVATRTKRK